MSERRVVITGMGAITPLGNNIDDYAKALMAGVSGAGPITRFDAARHDAKIACEVKGFNALEMIADEIIQHRLITKRMDTVSHYAVAAALEAVSNAGYSPGTKPLRGVDNTMAGSVVGSGVGGAETFEQQTRLLESRGPDRVRNLTIPKMMMNAPAYWINYAFGFHAMAEAVSTACASFNNAAANAYDDIRHGELDFIVVAGSEAADTALAVAAFGNMDAITKKFNDKPGLASRPFDRDRDGFVVGEGAGAFVFEPLDRVIARGAENRILGEVVGYGKTTDALDITAPDPDATQVYRAMELALKKAGVLAQWVDYVNAHGTSTPLNDAAEALAINKLFPHKPYVNSTKSMIGHGLGAAGALELAATLIQMRAGMLHRTKNLDNIDDSCILSHVLGGNIPYHFQYALLNSFGFGGHNTVLAIKRYAA